MSDFLIRPADIFDVIKRQKWVMLLTFLAVFGLSTTLAFVLPKKYLSETVIHIGVGYFQNPLVDGFISQTHDPTELRSEREKIIREAVDNKFAARIGEKFELLRTGPEDPGREAELEGIIKDIDISPITSTQFRIAYKGKSPQVAEGMIVEAVASIRQKLFENRIQSLEQLIGVVSAEANNSNEYEKSAGKSLTPRADNPRAQIAELTRKVNDLRKTYSDSHPTIQSLKEQINEIQRTGKAIVSPDTIMKKSAGGLMNKEDLLGGGGSAGIYSVKDKLIEQKHMINIAIELEKKDPTMTNYLSLIKEPTLPKTPNFPKVPIFVLFGIVGGVMFASIAAAIREFYERTQMHPSMLSKRMKMPYMGTIVIYPDKDK